MIITYFGKQFWKITQGEMVLAFNPVSKESKLKSSTRFGADVALVSVNHPDYNGVEQLSYGERMPFVVDGPGNYEVKDIFIHGAISNANLDEKKYVNTVYSFVLDSIKIVFLGPLGEEELSKEARELAESPDILFVPVGNKDTLNPKNAAKLAASLEPKLVIPMDYDDATLKTFLKEMGDEKADTLDKLTIKRKDLEGSEGKVIVLKSSQ
ncbi:MAG TPA: MBL fold metallo-hydrolase [Candidatus Paceibacterota bacterium]|nr:MBL fold metallo-hydrolase [Candidatus Paceibacterota bacterium]